MHKEISMAEMVSVQEAEVEQLVKRWREGSERDLSTVEMRIRDWALAVGCTFLARMVHAIAETSAATAGACPTCGGPLQAEGMRLARLHTSMGDVTYERRYFRCEQCPEGFFPLDQELGADAQRNTPALQRMVSLAGAVAPFEKAGEFLREVGGIPISAKKAEVMTEAVGQEVEQWLAARHQRAMTGLEKSEESAPGRLYVEADGTTVPTRVAEGASRASNQRAKGKVEYKEVKLGAVFEATIDESGKPNAGVKSYTGTFGDAETCVRQVRAEAKARGADDASEIVLLSDGAEWLQKRLPEAFEGRKVKQILDWCHPSERVTGVAHRVFGEETPTAKAWADQQRGLLYDGRTQQVIAAIEQLKPPTEEAQQYVRQALGYLRDNELSLIHI